MDTYTLLIYKYSSYADLHKLKMYIFFKLVVISYLNELFKKRVKYTIYVVFTIYSINDNFASYK